MFVFLFKTKIFKLKHIFGVDILLGFEVIANIRGTDSVPPSGVRVEKSCRPRRSLPDMFVDPGIRLDHSSVLRLPLRQGAEWKIQTESQHTEWKNITQNSLFQRNKIC